MQIDAAAEQQDTIEATANLRPTAACSPSNTAPDRPVLQLAHEAPDAGSPMAPAAAGEATPPPRGQALLDSSCAQESAEACPGSGPAVNPDVVMSPMPMPAALPLFLEQVPQQSLLSDLCASKVSLQQLFWRRAPFMHSRLVLPWLQVTH